MSVNVPILRQLCEHAICLIGATSNSHQKTRLVSKHRLNFVVRQLREVVRFDECVAAAVQFHVTVHLRTQYTCNQP